MNKDIPIFFTADDNYAPFLAVALSSAIKNSSKSRNYRAVILHQGLSKQNISRLSSLSTDNFIIDISPITANMSMLDDRMSNRLRCDYFTLTIYFRLFIPSLFPELDKCIYIDSDVILTGDIAELFDTDIGDSLIGACKDTSIADIPPLVAYTENAVGVKANEYINSGVLLMNLKKMRECGFEEHFLTLLGSYHFDSIAPDQDYINAICNGRIFYLSDIWDTMPNDARPPRTDHKLIHFNLFSKPWCYDGVQYGDIFWKYAEDCGYIDDIREYKENYTEDKKISDRECLDLLIKRSIKIPEQDITFKKLTEKGERIRL